MHLRIPHFVGPLSLLAVVGLFLAGTDRVSAQIRNNNFKQLNSQFSTGTPTGVFLEPDELGGTALANPDGSSSNFVSRLPGSFTSQLSTGFSETLPSINQGLTGSHSTLSSKNFDTKFSPLNGDMSNSPMWRSNFPLGRNFPTTMAPTPNLRQPQMSTTMQRNSSLNDATAYNRWKSPTTAPGKFTDAFVFHTNDNSQQLQQVGRELSLQDINRYQFQGESSSQPGLPITHAGGDADQVTATNGQILHSPKLFDFNPSLSNTAPSGSSVSPRIVTSDGSRPYLAGNALSPASNNKKSLLQNNRPASTQSAAAPGSNSSQPNSPTTVFRGEIPKNEAVLPQGKYQFTTPEGNKVPVELSAPDVTTDIEN